MRHACLRTILAVLAVALAGAAQAARERVLPRIDSSLPVREQYLPQLTSGPSSLAWSADSREIIYSMAGSLWRQRVDSDRAIQLTDGPGYDYQPDWSPDGRTVVYTSYRDDALELYLLDLATGESHRLTFGAHVNLEPRFSPDGKRLAWVSTRQNDRFHLFVADIAGDALEGVQQLTTERSSAVPRQYSPFDTEISPVWSRDGRSIIYVSSRDHLYGTGGFFEMEARAGAVPRELHYEETNWRARPDVSPDGNRVVYSSYLGRNWMQLWLLPSRGGDALPISYGDWDEVGARWSPDGRTIAFISNRSGNTSLWLQSVIGGTQRELAAKQLTYLRPVGRLELVLYDENGAPTSARVSITDARGRFHAPAHALVHADDAYDRDVRRFEAHYFHLKGEALVDVPAGDLAVDIARGPEFAFEHRQVAVTSGAIVRIESKASARLDADLADRTRFVSGDVHVHMNFGGNYRVDPERLLEQAAAEHLPVMHSLITNREQRFPDIAYSGRGLDPASSSDRLLQFGQEFHTNFWGHLGILGATGPTLIPGYVAYENTAAASLSPTNGDIADIAHERGALIGYIHPFFEVPDPAHATHLTKALPVDVALGKVDYIEVLGFSDHRATASVWYRLLNLGFRLPAAAGSDAMANYAAMHGPMGLNRVYVPVSPGPLDMKEWLAGLAAGRTFASNGPLLRFSLAGHRPGDEIRLPAGRRTLSFEASVRSFVPIDHIEVVCNGEVVRKIRLRTKGAHEDFHGTVGLARSGWCLLRASSDREQFPVLDNYVYATTSPIYITAGGRPPSSPRDAAYFQAWVERIAAEVEKYPSWNTPAEKAAVMEQLTAARSVYLKLQ